MTSMPQTKAYSATAISADTIEVKRVLIYSHDTFGLGNIRRMLAIAEKLVSGDPNLHVLMLTGSPMLHGFRVSSQIDFIKLPCLSRDSTGDYKARSLPLGSDRLLKMRARLIQSSIEDYQPHLVLVDKKPLGVEGELKLALKSLPKDSRRPAMALVLRDILDTPAATQKVWSKRDYHDVIEQYYDLVMVAGQPEIFDLSQEYAFPEQTRKRVRYCGYIQRDTPAAVKKQQSGKSVRVLVVAGGGGDGYHMIRNYLIGLNFNLSQHNLKSVVISGPEMLQHQQHELQQLSQGQSRLKLKEFSGRMDKHINNADVIVCMNGYNTICEVLSAGKRVVSIPRVTPVEEQLIRASRFEKRGLLNLIHPEKLTPSQLMKTIDSVIGKPTPQTKQHLDFTGLDRIQYWSQKMLEPKQQKQVKQTRQQPQPTQFTQQTQATLYSANSSLGNSLGSSLNSTAS